MADLPADHIIDDLEIENGGAGLIPTDGAERSAEQDRPLRQIVTAGYNGESSPSAPAILSSVPSW